MEAFRASVSRKQVFEQPIVKVLDGGFSPVRIMFPAYRPGEGKDSRRGPRRRALDRRNTESQKHFCRQLRRREHGNDSTAGFQCTGPPRCQNRLGLKGDLREVRTNHTSVAQANGSVLLVRSIRKLQSLPLSAEQSPPCPTEQAV
jgi:hypothetical protein